MYFDEDFSFLNNDLLSSGFAFLFLFILFISVAIGIISIIAGWKLFKKAGKKGWEAIIPFYNSWVYVEIAELNWWWFLLMLAPTIVSFVSDDLVGIANLAALFASFNCFYNIAKKFKKDTAVSVCAGIFNFIFLFIFAFSKNNQYYKDVVVSSNGVFPGKSISKEEQELKTEEQPKTEEIKYCKNCGVKIEEGYQFCEKCGNKID